MKLLFTNIWEVAKREANRMLSRPLYILVTLLLPILYILFFASLLKDGVPTKMPIAIVDLDQTATSRKIARTIDVTPLSKAAFHLQSENEAMSELRKGTIYGFVVIPQNFQADIFTSRQPVISYYYQNGFLIAGGLMQNDLTLILHTLSAAINIQKREAMGQPSDYIMSQVQPVQLSPHQLFNPTASYPVYITTIILPVMLQLFILLMTVYCIGIEIKEHTSREWLHLSDKSIGIALTGKLLPYTIIFFIVMMFQNFLLYKVMMIPMHTTIGWLMLGSLMFVLAYQAIGIFCIGLLPVMRHSLNMAAFYGILALTLCGFTFPIEAMPPVFQYWAAGFPVRHYMHLLQSQILAGFELRYSIISYLYLLIFLLIPFTIIRRLKSALIYHNFNEGFHSLPKFYFREFRHIFSDVGVMVLIFAVPLIYPLLYSFIYYPEVVRDLPIVVVDMSHSSESRLFARNIDATPELKVAANCISMEEAISMFKNREVRGIIQIPASFCSDLALNRQTTISTYSDMEFFLYYKAMLTGTSFVALETGNKIQINNLTNSGLTRKESEIIAEPLKFVDNAMANTAGGFASYGLPAALILIIQQTLIIAIGILAGTAREQHAFGTLVGHDRKRFGTLRLVTGKAATYFIIYALLCVYMLGMIPAWFGYGQSADFFELIALITPFLLSSIFLGLTISVIFKNRESSMMLYLWTSIPLLFLSGIIWPLSNFSPIWLAIREIFPSSNAILGFIKMNSLAATISETRKEIMTLWIQTGFYFLTACISYGYHARISSRLRDELMLDSLKQIRQRIENNRNSLTNI